jgi:hypothetical protein
LLSGGLGGFQGPARLQKGYGVLARSGHLGRKLNLGQTLAEGLLDRGLPQGRGRARGLMLIGDQAFRGRHEGVE